MSAVLRLRPSVLVAREKLAEGRDKLRAQHDRGSPGIQVCARLTDLLDTVVLDLYHQAADDLGRGVESHIALAPYGGYGRRDVAPFSDVDLMLLHTPGSEQLVAPFARRLTQDIVDAGLDLGFSLRTPRYACSLAMGDPTIFTSLVEARYLAGSVNLFTHFFHAFRRKTLRRSRNLIQQIEASREEEKRQHGDTIYLLNPNVKRSRGGLRDLQLVRWVGFARYGEAEPEALVRMGVLDRDDRRQLQRAREFLLRLRNEMHFHAGRPQDLLARDQQVRIADLYGYQGDEKKLPVERFMRDYIEHTSNVRHSAAHFVASAKRRRDLIARLGELFSYRMEGDFHIGPRHIRANRRGQRKVAGNVTEVLRLMDLANRTQTRIEHQTWQTIRESMLNQESLELSPEAIKRFLSLLEQPGRLGNLLRRLHELRVLEKIVPPMAHARYLMQFNEYHKYTVDEHSIRAIDCATEFRHRDDTLGRAYRGIEKKWLLHLALLLHDAGKGFSEDHSEVGERMAAESAEILHLSSRDSEILRFLVHKHLLMSHLAQWRDTQDDRIVLQFAFEVGSAEVLQMLYVLTCADLAAVGPGVLNNWKLDLITQLYRRTRGQLTGQGSLDDEDEWLDRRREEIFELVRDQPEARWWRKQLAELPRSYASEYTPQELVAHFQQLYKLPADDAQTWGRYLPDLKAMEYTIAAHEDITPGIFHRLTGALTSKGTEILSAEIHTLAEGLILDRFYVRDVQFSGEPPAERCDEICEALRDAVTGVPPPPTFQRTWTTETNEIPDEGRVPTRIRIDNNTSAKFTIIDVFTHDRAGLLYAITRALYELRLSVHGAKIGTHLDQVVDVFYVSGADGKIVDEAQLTEIRAELFKAIGEREAVSS